MIATRCASVPKVFLPAGMPIEREDRLRMIDLDDGQLLPRLLDLEADHRVALSLFQPGFHRHPERPPAGMVMHYRSPLDAGPPEEVGLGAVLFGEEAEEETFHTAPLRTFRLLGV